MEEAPIPRHERTWRHPSELGAPTSSYVATTPAGGQLVALLFGALTAISVVALLAAVTPRSGSAPTASAATTTPVRSSGAGLRSEASVPAASTPAGAALAALAPLRTVFDPDAATATAIPRPFERVLVVTESWIGHTTWFDLVRNGGPDGALVFNRDGQVLARCGRSELTVLVRE